MPASFVPYNSIIYKYSMLGDVFLCLIRREPCKLFIRNRGLAPSRQAYGILNSIFLIQKLGKDYFIKCRRLGSIAKRRIDTPRDKRTQIVPQTGVKT